MNKKAAEPITTAIIMIAALIAGFFIAKEIGLFAVYTPPIPSSTLSSYVNNWFYDTSIQSGTNWECQQSTSVNFRTSSLSYGSGSSIAYSSSACGSFLTAYIFSSAGGNTLGTCAERMPAYAGGSYSLLINDLPGGWRSGGANPSLWKNNGGTDLRICDEDLTNYYAYRYILDSGAVVSLDPKATGSMEVPCGNAPIQDSGNFTCENGNVVLKYCVYNSVTVFPSIIQDTCSIPCEFLSGQNVPGIGTRDIVKCSGNYKPNIKVCGSDGKTLYNTSSSGYLDPPSGFLCGVNNYNVCTNAICTNCSEGTSWCDGSKVMSCNSGQITNPDNCIQEGFACSSSGTAPDTTASCSSSIPEGNPICNGTQPQKYSVTQRKYIDNGPNCRTSCSAGVCVNMPGCIDSSSVKCDIGTLFKCDVNTAGNIWVNYSSESQCVSGICNSDNKTCAPKYNLGWEYCGGSDGKQRQKAVSDPSGNVLTGGIIIQNLLVSRCIIACNASGNPQITSCEQLTQCKNKAGQDVCRDSISVGRCSEVGDNFTSITNCLDLNPRGFCNGEVSPAKCSFSSPECGGTFGCSSDNNIHTCDTFGYFVPTPILESCNSRGCFLTDLNTPSNTNSQCNNDCDPSGKKCSGNQLKNCKSMTVSDKDGTQLIFDDTNIINCLVGCSGNSCVPQKDFLGRYCEGTHLMEAISDPSNIPGGGVTINERADCTAGCDSINKKCNKIHSFGKYCSGNNISEAVPSIEEAYIKDGGVKINPNLDTCELGCRDTTTEPTTASCVTDCDGTTECDSNDGKVHTCSSRGVKGSVLYNCNNGCSEVNKEGKCNPIKSFGKYCDNSFDLWEAVTGGTVEDGGVKLQKVITCNVLENIGGCTEGPPATCKPIHTLGKFCDGSTLKQATNSTSLANGYVSISTIRTCGISCRENSSVVPTDASCVTDCDGTTECSNGVVRTCSNGETGIITLACNAGCTEVNNEGICKPIHTLGKFCSANGQSLMWALNDNSALVDGKVRIDKIADCTAGCENIGEDNAQCKRAREPGSYCDGTKLMDATVDQSGSEASIPNGGILLNLVQQCPAQCQELTQTAPTEAQCVLDCTPNQPVCKASGVWSCTSTGLYDSLIDSCHGFGCSNSTNRCKDECPIKTMDMCKLGDAYRCLPENKSYTTIPQLLLEKQYTCNNGCSDGSCVQQCTGDLMCYNVDGNLHRCSNGERQETVVSCKNGCNTQSLQCNNECDIEGQYQCDGSDSKLCIKNITTFNSRNYIQYLWSPILCGSQGCNQNTGQCVANTLKNSHVCVGDALHSTDSNGFISETAIKICSQEILRNGIQPFCKSSTLSTDYNDCLVCNSVGQYVCTDTQLYQCGDIYQGTKTNIQNCEVGCLNKNGNYYCDQLNAVIALGQNFLSDEDVSVNGYLKRSKSGDALIITNIKGTLTGGGQNKVVTGSSGTTGKFDLNFGRLALGTYSVLIEIPNYNKQYTINVKVTNDFRLSASGTQTLIKIPGTKPSIDLKIDGGTGSPDDIVENSLPEGITSIDVKKNEILGKWQLFVEGIPGIYQINLSAVQNGVPLDGQIVPVEITRPKLTITSNAPDSKKPGQGTFDIKTTGPSAQDKLSDTLRPDIITATMSHSPAETLNLLEIGSGSYTFVYDFKDIGTYTLNVVASKEGYDNMSFSKTIQITNTGTSTTSGGGGSGGSTTTSTSGNGTAGANVLSGITSATGLSQTTIIILVVIGIIVFFILRRKR